MRDKASECIMSIMAVFVLVYKSFCNTFIVMQIKLVAVVVVDDVLMSMYHKES